MTRRSDTLRSKRGRNRLKGETEHNVTTLIRLRDQYIEEENWGKAVEIIGMMLPYQLPKLSAVDLAPDDSTAVNLLKKLVKVKQIPETTVTEEPALLAEVVEDGG